jgi:hypothetical protein
MINTSISLDAAVTGKFTAVGLGAFRHDRGSALYDIFCNRLTIGVVRAQSVPRNFFNTNAGLKSHAITLVRSPHLPEA